MTGFQSLAARAALGSVAAAATFALPAVHRLYRGTAADFDRRLRYAFIASRAAFFLLIFFVLRIAPRGDILTYYYGETVSLLHGGIPYKTILTIYAPLHTFMEAPFVWLWNSPLVIIVLAIAFECVALPLWMRVARALWPQDDRAVRIAGLLYLACPVSLQFVTVDGQDNVLIGLFFALALLALLRYRNLLSGLMVGAAVSLVKMLPLLFAPLFFASLPRRWRFAAGGLLATVPVYGVFALYRLNILLPFTQGSLKGAGGMPYLVETAFRANIRGGLWDLLLYAALLALYLFAAYSITQGLRHLLTPADGHIARLRVIFFGLAAVLLTLLFVAKKTWPTYLMMALFPICLLAARQVLRSGWRARLLFAFFGLVCVLEHSLYSSVMANATALNLHDGIAARAPIALVFLVVEILLVGGYAWLLALSLAAMRRSARLDQPPAQPEPLVAASA